MNVLATVGLTILLLGACLGAALTVGPSGSVRVGGGTPGTRLAGAYLGDAHFGHLPFSASRSLPVLAATHADYSSLPSVATVRVGSSPESVAYDSAKGQVFVTNVESANVSVINDTSDTVVATVPVGTWPSGAAYDSARGEVFVANAGSSNVSVINDTNDTVVATVPVGAGPEGIAYDPGKGEVFVANNDWTNVSVIDDSTNRVVATVHVGFGPVAIAYDATKGEVFVTNYGPNTVSVINDTNDTVVATIPVGSLPGGAVYDPAKGDVFIVNWGSNDVSVISDSTDMVVATVPVGTEPESAAYDSAGGVVFVTDSWCSYDRGIDCQQGNVSVINDTTDTMAAMVAVGPDGAGIVYDAAKGEMFVTIDSLNGVIVMAAPNFLGPYWVAVTESGLPPGTPWSVTAADATERSTTSWITFSESTRSVPYRVVPLVPSGPWYAPSPSTGIVPINAPIVTVPITFSPLPNESLTFRESGLARGSLWGVTLGYPGYNYTSTTGTTYLRVNAPVSTFPYSLTTLTTGYSVAKIVGPGVTNQSWLTVTGPGTIAVTFGHVETLTFTEARLGAGLVWGVTITSALRGGTGSQGANTTNSTLSFTVVTGPYRWAARSSTSEYEPVRTHGTVGIGSAGKVVKVVFREVTSKVTFTEKGLPRHTEWTVTIQGGPEVNGTGGSITLRLPNGTYDYTATSSNPKYRASAPTGSFTVTAPVGVEVGETFNDPAVSEPALPSVGLSAWLLGASPGIKSTRRLCGASQE